MYMSGLMSIFFLLSCLLSWLSVTSPKLHWLMFIDSSFYWSKMTEQRLGCPLDGKIMSILFGSMPFWFRAGQGLIRYLMNVFSKCLLSSKPAKGFFFWCVCLFLGRFFVHCITLWKYIWKLECTSSLEKEWKLRKYTFEKKPWHFYMLSRKVGVQSSQLKELRRRSCFLKTLAKLFKIVISNPFQSSPSSAILVPFCSRITPFFFLP